MKGRASQNQQKPPPDEGGGRRRAAVQPAAALSMGLDPLSFCRQRLRSARERTADAVATNPPSVSRRATVSVVTPATSMLNQFAIRRAERRLISGVPLGQLVHASIEDVSVPLVPAPLAWKAETHRNNVPKSLTARRFLAN